MKGVRVRTNLTLIDDATFVRMYKLDRIFDGEDVPVLFTVQIIDNGSKRSRLTRTGRTRDEKQTVGLTDHLLDDFREFQDIDVWDIDRDFPEHATHGSSLEKKIAPETSDVLDAKR